jgi:hypothetical protein
MDGDESARAKARMRMVPDRALCCFCGHAITDEDGIALGVHHSEESVQGFTAHIRCLQEKLHPDFAEHILR